MASSNSSYDKSFRIDGKVALVTGGARGLGAEICRALASGGAAVLLTDVLDGFVAEDGYAHGRPVGVAIDQAGALLVADDAGNSIWRVTKESAVTAAR